MRVQPANSGSLGMSAMSLSASVTPLHGEYTTCGNDSTMARAHAGTTLELWLRGIKMYGFSPTGEAFGVRCPDLRGVPFSEVSSSTVVSIGSLLLIRKLSASRRVRYERFHCIRRSAPKYV